MPYKITSKYIDSGQRGRRFKKAAWVVLILVLMASSFGVGLYLSQKNEVIKELAKKEVVYAGQVLGKYGLGREDLVTKDIDFSLFWEVWDTLEKEYVDKGKINEKEMFYGALKGMVASFKDPYTVYLDPKLSREFEEDLSGTFEGIGAEIGIRDETLTIVAPLEGMPAQIAGLKAGDKVYAIDGESTMGIMIDEAVRKIRGPKGTVVTLTISRDGFESAEDIKITRGTIIVKSVKTTYRDDNIYIIKVTNFNGDTMDLFNQAVREALTKNPKGIILDLRNNPGGYLDVAVEMASEWVEDGIVVTEQFSEEKKNEYQARGRARLKDFKTVVLVNQGSASASEIVAGALRDLKKATIVGMQTFGKGSVQSLEGFKDGSSVKITVAKWLTPNGDNINEEGIAPDVEVDLTAEQFEANEDPQMEKAVDLFK